MKSEIKIGITERGDAGLDLSWAQKMNTVNGAVLITKDPNDEFVSRVKEFQNRVIVHVTITGLGSSIYEPGAPSPEITMRQFRKVQKILGPDKTVLRIDPIIPTGPEIEKAVAVYNALSDIQHRTRVSIIDNYPHVQWRFNEAGVDPLSFKLHAPVTERARIINLFRYAEVCGEPGFNSIGCISNTDLEALGLPLQDEAQCHQRQHCHCIGSIKTELLSRKTQCKHGCIYCYWKGGS